MDSIKVIKRQKQREKLFDENMRASDVESLLKIRPFKLMDKDLFPKSNTLEKIILSDTRIRRFKESEIILRQGDYGESAFLILSGSVSAVFDIDNSYLGRDNNKKKTFFEAAKQIFVDHSVPERREVESYKLRQDTAHQVGGITFLQDMAAILKDNESRLMSQGKIFGHVSSISRAPRSATVIARENTEVLEVKWQALRDIMRYSKYFRDFLEEEYRKKSLSIQLRSIDVFKSLDEEEMTALSSRVIFETYGSSDWNSSLRKAKESDAESVVFKEELIVAEGDYAEDLIVIRGGFARLTKSFGSGRKTLDYKKRGDVFGFLELERSAVEGGAVEFQHSLYALGYTDIIRIPGELVREYLKKSSDKSSQIITSDVRSEHTSLQREKLLNLFVDNLYINGTKTMVVNLDRCTECDDCVTACANAHGGNPRFIRHGPKSGRYMIANACMHCSDPVCMIGCPTGAIQRDTQSGAVIINDQSCIGCSTCANSCPYDNIRMTNITGLEGEVILDESHSPISKATKCDLCIDQQVAPACENSCPNNALKRLDAHDIDNVKEWMV